MKKVQIVRHTPDGQVEVLSQFYELPDGSTQPDPTWVQSPIHRRPPLNSEVLTAAAAIAEAERILHDHALKQHP